MSIKSDRWIRRMAKEHGMIEPFVEDQVREGVISYGVSSYGYDVRIADEFKIFTNINSTIVDPKRFDPRSFVDFEGEVCIIPPNSFALARTVEYFRIPRNVLTVCVGKCVSGETRVMDAGSGHLRRIDGVVGGAGTTASLSRSRVGSHDFSEGVAQGVLPVLEVVTRTGRRLRATPNHPLLTFEGWRALQDLGPGARIAVPREVPVFGAGDLPDWELDLLGLMVSDGQCRTPGWSPTCTSGDPVLHELFARATTSFGCVASRVTRLSQRASNRAGRGGAMEPNRLGRWLASFGLDVGSPEKFVPDAVFGLRRERLARFMRALWSGDGGVSVSGDSIHLEYCSTSERLARDVHHLLLRFGITAFLRHRDTASGRGAWVLSVTSRDQIRRFAERVGFVPGCRKQRHLEEAVALIEVRPQQRSNFDTLPPGAWSLIGDLCRTRGTSLRGMGVMRTMPRQSVPMGLARDLAERLGDEVLGDLVDSDLLWDTIVSKRFAGLEPVYDLTLPETHNFVADDVLVHNSTYARCGIIVNVTPFEPEWEGIVTLEVSNTTPLPAKIYANEGIAQVLFFESDEDCETSYADKKGKYQAQKDLTLPRL